MYKAPIFFVRRIGSKCGIIKKIVLAYLKAIFLRVLSPNGINNHVHTIFKNVHVNLDINKRISYS